MDTKELYYAIEDMAKIEGNGHYFMGDNPFYKFEPGTSKAPHELSISYNPDDDVGNIRLKISNIGFLNDLKRSLVGGKPKVARLNDEQSDQWIKYNIEVSDFGKTHIDFALALRALLDKNRYRIPSLVTADFKEEGNDEYCLYLKNGNLWVDGYVFHGAEYKVLIVGFDLSGFKNTRDLADYANSLVNVEESLKRNKFTVTLEDGLTAIDLHVQTKAESEAKIKSDLETIIDIVSS